MDSQRICVDARIGVHDVRVGDVIGKPSAELLEELHERGMDVEQSPYNAADWLVVPLNRPLRWGEPLPGREAA